jgi:hypothetical protein
VNTVTDSWPTEEHLLGFDAREMLPTAESWTTERRTLYLLRPDVRRPLSADSGVWLSLYDDGISGFPRPGVPSLRPPKWTGPNASLWEDLGNLERHLARAPITVPYRLVAFTWLADASSLNEPRSHGPYDEPMTPGERSPEWQFLGCDVGDGSLLSGLTNCGFGDQRETLTKEWGPRLNEHHLFQDAESAFAFRLVTNRRVPEHAPFFVYGLWLISEVLPG